MKSNLVNFIKDKLFGHDLYTIKDHGEGHVTTGCRRCSLMFDTTSFRFPCVVIPENDPDAREKAVNK